eukprot:2214739-Pyramimonas_sp.AAC.2
MHAASACIFRYGAEWGYPVLLGQTFSVSATMFLGRWCRASFFLAGINHLNPGAAAKSWLAPGSKGPLSDVLLWPWE